MTLWWECEGDEVVGMTTESKPLLTLQLMIFFSLSVFAVCFNVRKWSKKEEKSTRRAKFSSRRIYSRRLFFIVVLWRAVARAVAEIRAKKKIYAWDENSCKKLSISLCKLFKGSWSRNTGKDDGGMGVGVEKVFEIYASKDYTNKEMGIKAFGTKMPRSSE